MKFLALFLCLFAQFAKAESATAFTFQKQAYLEPKNYLKNPGAEEGKAGWTASGGTLTTTTSTLNVAVGKVALSWDGSATGQTLTNSGAGVMRVGTQCYAKVRYKTTESTNPYVLEVINGATVFANTTLSAVSNFTLASASFPCDSTNSHTFRIRTASTAGDPAIIYLDDAYLGYDYNWSTIGQAEFVGSAYFAGTTNCQWTRTNTAIGAFGTDADCPGPTIEFSNLGTWSTTDTDLPRLSITNLPAGRYAIIATGQAGCTTADCLSRLVISDGTTTSGLGSTTTTNGDSSQFTVVANFSYTGAGDRTFNLHGSSTAGTLNVFNATQQLNFAVYRYPSTLDTASRLDGLGWYVDANISGANPSLGIVDVSSYTGIENGSLTLTQNSGSADVQIPCSSTNAPSGTTCSAGNESVGVVFTIPTTGVYQVCAEFGHDLDVGTGGGNGIINTYFQLVETATNSQTIIQDGKSRVQSGMGAPAVRVYKSNPVNVCGLFTFTTIGTKAIRLFYEQNITDTVSASVINADAVTSDGQRDIHITVRPWNQNASVIIPEAVTSNSTGRERVERANVAASCTSSPCTIASQSGNWLSSITRVGTGDYELNFAAGIFSGTPSCAIMPINTAVNLLAPNVGSRTRSSTKWAFFSVNAAAAAADIGFDVICMGPR